MKRVYRFGGKEAEGNGQMRNLLGGKGANLAEMCTLGIPVPAGFTITTECCTEYYALGGGYTEELKHDVAAALKATEAIMGKKFGDPKNPLLVSCRSGARSSMPGIELRAPERQLTSSGFFGSPNFLPMMASVALSASATSFFSSAV